MLGGSGLGDVGKASVRCRGPLRHPSGQGAELLTGPKGSLVLAGGPLERQATAWAAASHGVLAVLAARLLHDDRDGGEVVLECDRRILRLRGGELV